MRGASQRKTIFCGTRAVFAASAADSSSASSGSGDGSSSSTASSGQSDRIHSTDIAFKPNNDGWGYTPKYKSSYERIFGKKQGSDAVTEAAEKEVESTVPTTAESAESADGFLRKGFTMRLKFDGDNFDEIRQKYADMHSEHALLGPLLSVLKDHGVRNYSIFLSQDREDPTLFGYVEVQDEEQWQSISTTKECKEWWKEMSAIMETNADNSPKSADLDAVFFMD